MKIVNLSVTLFVLTFCTSCNAQKIENNEKAIQKALTDIQIALPEFEENLKGQAGIDSAIYILINDRRIPKVNEFHQFVFGNLIFSMSPDKSFKYHETAYTKKPNDQNFILEYAIDLHRKQEFAKAIEQYKKYLSANPDNYSVNVWLADCYININDPKTAINYWKQADHAKHHVGIDNAIHTIYGTDPILKRDLYLKNLKTGQTQSLYELIALDANWKTDWWNVQTKDEMMESDINFAIKKFGNNNAIVKTIIAYKKIKTAIELDSIKAILKANNLIIDNGIIPKNGDLASDLVRICIENKLIVEKDFYNKRGDEILKIAKETKDVQMLNLYAHLQLTVNNKIDEGISEFGWKECKDERFAYDYFLGKNGKLKCDKTEIEKAIMDFQNSSILFKVKYDCNNNADKSKKELLLELIRREFKSLLTDPNRYSYQLKNYFALLEKEM